MDILPGEPVPPGFEDEVKRKADIQQKLDEYKGNALIGIEYTIELHEDDRREAGYLCLLCDKRGDPRTILNHWSSFNHRMKYLEKHYPTAVREFQPVKYKPNSHNLMILIVQSLAEAIEDHHGRLPINVLNSDDFRRQKTHITKQIMTKNHFDERSGPNFVSSVDKTLWENTNIKKPADNNHKRINVQQNTGPKPTAVTAKDDLDEISSEDDHHHETTKKVRISGNQDNNAAAARQQPRNSNEANNGINPEIGKKLPTPRELSKQASHIAQERYKWEKYRCMLEIHLKQVKKIQMEYEKSPEKHPQYPDEWKKFWNRRYKELQAEKKVDPNRHDYKPEWIVYWTKRMKDLFDAEIEKKKKEIKGKLGLPENAEEQVDQLKERYKLPVARGAVPPQAAMSNQMRRNDMRGGQPAVVIDISDDESPMNSRRNRQRPRSRSRSRSRSPPRQYHRRHRTRSRSRSPRALSPFSDEYGSPMRRGGGGGPRTDGSRADGSRAESSRADYYGSSSGYSRSRYPAHAASSSHYSGPGHSHYRVLDSSKIPKYEESDSHSAKDSEPPEEPDENLTVVVVLRLLTALEEYLGSLGSKVVDLLGKALALEKVKANSADDLLLDEDHCVFFETIKEKLKGLLMADMIEDKQKVRAIKRAVRNIAAVVHQVNSNNKGGSSKTGDDTVTAADANLSGTTKKKNVKGKKPPTVKDLPFDRQLVATKLAAALVMQGREDVSTEEMDKLIFMFLLMSKISKTKREVDGKPVYCKDILPQIGIAVESPVVIKAKLGLSALPAIVDEFIANDNIAMEVHDDRDSLRNDRSPARNDTSGSSMLESLTDSDLQTLLQNFKHLSSEEQHHLVAHLKKLESADPARVEKLRKFVNLSDDTDASAAAPAAASSVRSSTARARVSVSPPRRSSSTTHRNANVADESKRVNPNKFSLDDDEDDDYNFDDVFKAASSNVNRLSEEKKRSTMQDVDDEEEENESIPDASTKALTFNPSGLNTALNDTQNLIANLMGSLQQSNSSSNGKHNLPFYQQQQQQQQQPPQQQQLPPPHHAPPQQQQQHHQQEFNGPMPSDPYNQMNPNAAGYYNNQMPGYNQQWSGNSGGYQQWGGPPQQQMPNYGMPNFPPNPQWGYGPQ